MIRVDSILKFQERSNSRMVFIAGIIMMASFLTPWTLVIGKSSYYRRGIGLVEESFMVLEFPLMGYVYYTTDGEVVQGWIEMFPLRSVSALMVLISGFIILREFKRRKVDARMFTIAIILGLAAPAIFGSVDSVAVSFPEASNLSQSYSIIPLGIALPIIAGGLSLYQILKVTPPVKAAPPERIPSIYTARRCPVCGYPIAGNYIYCPNCGSRLSVSRTLRFN